MIYRIIAALLIIIFVIIVIRKNAAQKGSFGKVVKTLFAEMLEQINLFRNIARDKNLTVLLRKSCFGLATLMFLILAATSIIPLLLGFAMSGVLLILHLTAAPVFVVSVTVYVVLRAHDLQFSPVEIDFIKESLRRNKSLEKIQKPESLQSKIYFWLFTVFVIPATLSILFSMYPFFGTNMQVTLLEIHKLSVLALMIIFGFSFITHYSR